MVRVRGLAKVGIVISSSSSAKTAATDAVGSSSRGMNSVRWSQSMPSTILQPPSSGTCGTGASTMPKAAELADNGADKVNHWANQLASGALTPEDALENLVHIVASPYHRSYVTRDHFYLMMEKLRIWQPYRWRDLIDKLERLMGVCGFTPIDFYNSRLRLQTIRTWDHVVDVLEELKDQALVPNNETWDLLLDAVAQAHDKVGCLKVVQTAIAYTSQDIGSGSNSGRIFSEETHTKSLGAFLTTSSDHTEAFQYLTTISTDATKAHYRMMLKSLRRRGDAVGFTEVLNHFLEAGFQIDTHILADLLILEFNKFGYAHAYKMYQELELTYGFKPDLEIYHAMITILGRAPTGELVLRVWEDMATNNVEPTPSIYTEMIATLLANSLSVHAMQYVYLLTANHSPLERQQYQRLIKVFFKANDPQLANEIWKDLVLHHTPTSRAYATQIVGLCDCGKFDDAVQQYEKAPAIGIPYDGIIYSAMIKGSQIAGTPDDGINYLNAYMNSDVTPHIASHNYLWILHRLCKAKRIRDAELVIWQLYRYYKERQLPPPVIFAYEWIIAELLRDLGRERVPSSSNCSNSTKRNSNRQVLPPVAIRGTKPYMRLKDPRGKQEAYKSFAHVRKWMLWMLEAGYYVRKELILSYILKTFRCGHETSVYLLYDYVIGHPTQLAAPLTPAKKAKIYNAVLRMACKCDSPSRVDRIVAEEAGRC
ncbi:hypothetical protein SeMB42_g03174 [Synchytrium endobioticum]|uniref:Pentacotripeptide-repeat region of PRORP domain-containing protein n=1 Tax=Synchytrium endobioticum TaxID=286115 RepID=A0A507D8M7_9FUNG|nr:hypothetical protein SeMB42_g03174 [Synchytrium endobioticum]